VVLTARGQVFVAPVKQGRFIEVTRKDGVRYRQAHFLPAGESLVVLSDESGEVEWWRLPADGFGDRQQLTDDGKILRFNGFPSPDGRWIVYNDHNQELWLLEIGTGESKKIAFAPLWWFDNPHWSPDSRYFLYGMQAANSFNQIYLYSLEGDESVPITNDSYESINGRWSPDGDWIYFLSERHFTSRVGSPWGRRQPEPYFENMTKLYMMSLVEGTRSPFQPDDELYNNETDEDFSESEEVEKIQDISIDLHGIQERLFEIPVSS